MIVVFNSEVGDNAYYLETIPSEGHAANVFVENDQEEPGHNDEDIEVIEAKAYKSTAGTRDWVTCMEMQ